MMIDLLQNNIVLMYFFILIFFLKPEKMQENHKIFIVYLFGLFIDYLGLIKTSEILLLTTISLFLYLEYFNDSVFKRDVMKKLRYKLMDFIYLMFFQYYFGYYLFIIFVNTQTFSNFTFMNLVDYNGIKILSTIMLFHLVNLLYSLDWKIKSLDQIKNTMDKIVLIRNLDVKEVKKKEYLVIRLEDKSFLKRKKCTTIFSVDYVKNYVIPRIKIFKNKKIEEIMEHDNVNFQYIFNHLKRVIRYGSNECKKIFRRVKLALTRGNSTIEAQIIRTIGIEKGYHPRKNLIIKRKIFEIFYTKIVFESLKDYYELNLYPNREYMKEYLLYIYLMTAKITINNKTFHGIKEMYGRNLNEITNDELFIAVISMCRYNLTEFKIFKQSLIYNYKISYPKICEIVNEI